MTCERAREHFLAHSLGEAVPAEVLEHIESCSECQHAFDQFVATGQLLRGLGSAEPDKGFAEGVMAKVASEPGTSKPFRRVTTHPSLGVLLAAASVTIFVSVAGLVWVRSNSPMTEEASAGAAAAPTMSQAKMARPTGAEEEADEDWRYEGAPADDLSVGALSPEPGDDEAEGIDLDASAPERASTNLSPAPQAPSRGSGDALPRPPAPTESRDLDTHDRAPELVSPTVASAEPEPDSPAGGMGAGGPGPEGADGASGPPPASEAADRMRASEDPKGEPREANEPSDDAEESLAVDDTHTFAFDGITLENAFAQVSRETGEKIQLEAGSHADVRIYATLEDVTADDAIEQLSELAGLETIRSTQGDYVVADPGPE